MSWLARSIVDSLRIDDDNEEEEGCEKEEDKDKDKEDDVENVDLPNPEPPQSEVRSNEHEVVENYDDDDDRIGRGVKEDFTELRESLTRQLLGVASFLAPPPPPPPPPPPFGNNRTWRGEPDLLNSGYDSSEELLESSGISENLVPCQDGLGGLQSNISTTDEADSNYFYFEEDQLDDVVGVTEEVLAFAINIAHHPETWLDFPLEEEEDDNDDFDLSDAQYKHVLAIQHYAPRLTALKIELCPAHMNESYFWMVYFVLLNSRLSRQDAEALSTAQLVTARTMWMRELQKRTKQETERFRSSSSHGESNARSSWNGCIDHSTDEDENESHGNRLPLISGLDPLATDFGTGNQRIVDSELQIIDKAVIEDKDLAVGSSFKLPILHKYDEDDEDDDWLNDNPELDGYTRTTVLMGNEEDISFSDLEDNDDCFIPVKSKVVIK
ncbi:uncharacterized protein LOC124925490 [Impatiens glandulifera]|uniref:uncharacterized protein LOC124925490 n=1 Tax=Impatiens glandulifera TaxID=253017 RepID=UPI001FB182B9|nr:uncharacterized protein LOC124925490 [Impatiens glandulifera]